MLKVTVEEETDEKRVMWSTRVREMVLLVDGGGCKETKRVGMVEGQEEEGGGSRREGRICSS